MKKCILIIITFALCSQSMYAQGKVKVMLEQISELTTTLKTLKQGYNVVDKGLTTVHSIKNGSFSLNQTYFNSLKQVSPAVKNNPKLPVIASDQQEIIALFQNELNWQRQQAVLDEDEMNYFRKVNENILSACNKDLDDLKPATEPGTEMSDDERIKRIDKVYLSTVDKYQFSRSFIDKSHSLAIFRQQKKEQNTIVKKLYDLN